MKITKNNRGSKIENSRKFISLNLTIKEVFKLPKIILLYNQSEYAPHKITPKAPTIALITFVL